MTPFGSSYDTPGWQRAQARTKSAGEAFAEASAYGRGFGTSSRGSGGRRGPAIIEGEILAKSTGAPSTYMLGDRVLHLKFGPGAIADIDGNKLTVDFDKAGRKMVLESFVERAG
jgi:DNA helicase-2/ATP-dependent DNA helicase PcrA